MSWLLGGTSEATLEVLCPDLPLVTWGWQDREWQIGESSRGPLKCSGSWSRQAGQAEGAGFAQSGEEYEAPNICLQLPKGELQRRKNQTFLRLAQQEDKRPQSQAAIREILTGCKEEFFMMEVVKRWKKLPKEAVKSPTLEIFKTQLVKNPQNQVWNGNCTSCEQGLELDDVPTKLNYSTIQSFCLIWF